MNGAFSITTNGGAVDLSFADADSLLNGNGTAPAQTGSVAADVTVTGTISVAEASSVLGATYDVVDDAATVASALTAGNAEVNGAASITTNGGAVDLSFADADSLLNGNGTAPAQSGSVAADVTVTDDISVSRGIECAWHDLRCFDDAATVAGAMTAGNAEVNGAASITTNGGAVDLSFADADSLLNGNGTAPIQTGSVAADVTVTGTISVAEASSVLGATYDILDDAAIIAAELAQPQAGGVSLGAQYDEIITSGDMAGGSTMVDVFPLTFNDPDGGSRSVTIDAFGTNPDGTLLDSNNEPDFPYDTTLGVRIKSTGAWVGDTNDDADGQYGGNMYESQVTFDAEAGVEYEVVVGAYSDSVPLNYGVTYTTQELSDMGAVIGENVRPLNQNASIALNIPTRRTDPDGLLDDGSGSISTETGSPEVNGANSITTNGGPVSLTLEEADALLNGNGTAPAQSGSVAADVTVTDDISVAQASDVLGTTYDVVDDAAIVASALTAGNAEVNGAASITTNGGAVDLSFADADSLLNGNGTAPAQTGSVAADVTVTDDISVSQASIVLGATYDVVDDAATVASALTAGDAEVNGAASITTNGGAVSLSFEDADSLLNGNDFAPLQTGSVAADVTVTGTISVSEASSVLGTTYHILDDADIIAEALVAQGYRDGMDQFVISREDEAEILGGPLFPQLPDGMSEGGIREQILSALEEMDGGLPNGPMFPPLPDGMPLPGDDMDWSESMTMGDGSEESGSPGATGTGIPEINSAASVTTNGGSVSLTYERRTRY